MSGNGGPTECACRWESRVGDLASFSLNQGETVIRSFISRSPSWGQNTMPSKSQSERIHEKYKASDPRPPHGRPELANNGDSGAFTQARTGGIHRQQKAGTQLGIDAELVKHMSSLPGFLQRGEKPQDKILNFGVLDWESLEKWRHKEKPSLGQSRPGASLVGSSSSASRNIPSTAPYTEKSEVQPSWLSQTSRSEVHSSDEVDPSSRFLHCGSKVTSGHDSKKYCLGEEQRKTKKGKSRGDGKSKKSSCKTKTSDSYQNNSSGMGMSSYKEKSSVLDDTSEKLVEKRNGLQSDTAHQHQHKRQDSIILLQPKDFCGSTSLDESHRSSLSGNAAELNWSSFSDVFSVEEHHFENSTFDIPHSCPLPFLDETELDINLSRLIHGQRMQPSSDQPSLSSSLIHKVSASFDVDHDDERQKELTSSATLELSKGLDHQTSYLTNAKDPSLARQLSSGIRRLSRSLSFKEGSTPPPLNRASIRSGPAQASNFYDGSGENRLNNTPRGRINSFKRFLDPLLKQKSAKPSNLADNSLLYMEILKNLSLKRANNIQIVSNGKSWPAVVKAVLQLTMKGGLPLFRFMVETNNEVLASTVKRLSAMGSDDTSWIYSFYSVQEVKRKSSSWKYQGSKLKTPEFSYNVIGQMKVSKPLPHDDGDELVRESVLYGLDPSKVEKTTSRPAVNRELGAIVTKTPKVVYESEVNTPSSIVVILPGAVHSMPNEGAPASLINRWKSGGLCDCGGWDVGCKLKVITNQDDQDDKLLSSYGCSLFLKEGNGKQNRALFRLVEHGASVYSVEYDCSVSSLQAFAISVAVLSGDGSEARNGHRGSKSPVAQREGTRYATYPPHSPVSRA